ncbi:prolyl 4-hydroxylase subunit alpha-1 isoform X2 [Drosophila ananassae]|uniref:prolyl 4-hydroxylase subunit alpha-1 isoform X2 n=1 Tax=Drosophila ananassae TaxID=7217 RepID=UPI0013A5E158|nr:prolyl 4-hydroxylase subunit alpha-1 isoform X2 [Drosophila ananassae]
MHSVSAMNPSWLIFLFGLATALKKMRFATSTHEMAKLLQLEDDLILDMRQYVEALQLKINTMRLFQKEWENRLDQADENPTTHVANPLVSFPLVRRMHMDTPKLFKFAREDVSYEKFLGHNLDHINLMELQEAADGFFQFLNIYSLNENEVANGKLYGKQYNVRLSAADCFALGNHLERLKLGNQAVKWFNISLEQYDDSLDPVYKILESSRSQIWQYMGLTLVKMQSHAAFKKSLELTAEDDHVWSVNHLANNLGHMFIHLETCRGRNTVPKKFYLRCRYFTEGDPFLQLAPLKLEQLNLDPFIGIFHDVISIGEQKNLINLTRNRLRLQNPQRAVMEAEVELNASKEVERIHRRIEDMTGLNLEESPPLTILNYGIGGQHPIHLDCEQFMDFGEPQPQSYTSAKVLFYLSDVQMGGYASFPELGFGFKPSRGSALVVHNMDNAANCDIRSLQATCPVLLGTHWVASKWISGSGQWRRKPCRM